jgi:hypothetical protein
MHLLHLHLHFKQIIGARQLYISVSVRNLFYLCIWLIALNQQFQYFYHL